MAKLISKNLSKNLRRKVKSATSASPSNIMPLYKDSWTPSLSGDSPPWLKLQGVFLETWDFVQIQLNYLNETSQAGMEWLKMAADRGLPVIIMEPLLGGNLAKPPAPELQKIWDQAETKRTPAEWALRWLWKMPEVTTILSGMSTMEQVEGNLTIAHGAIPGCLTEKESALIDQARDFLTSRHKVNCTECAYCQPCPGG